MNLDRSKKILVTGATGFIGSHLVRRLVRAGFNVVGTKNVDGTHRLANLGDKVTIEPLDLQDDTALNALFRKHKFASVFHLAAAGVRAGSGGIADVLAVNTLATIKLAKLVQDQGVDRFVFVGSGFEYEPQDHPLDENAVVRPVNFYGATKAAASVVLDELWRMEQLPLIIVRPFSVYGPSENPGRFIPYVIAQALARETMELTHCTQVRDYLYVEDLVDGLASLITKIAPLGSIYNFGSGSHAANPIRKVVETILELTGASPELAVFGAVERSRPEPNYFVADSSKAIKDLGWSPQIGLREGLGRTIDWTNIDLPPSNESS